LKGGDKGEGGRFLVVSGTKCEQTLYQIIWEPINIDCLYDIKILQPGNCPAVVNFYPFNYKPNFKGILTPAIKFIGI